MPVEPVITFHKSYRKLWEPLPPNRRREVLTRLTQRKRDPFTPAGCRKRHDFIEDTLERVVLNWNHKKAQMREKAAADKNTPRKRDRSKNAKAKQAKRKQAKQAKEESESEEDSGDADSEDSEDSEDEEEEDDTPTAENGEKLFEVEAILDRDNSQVGSYLVRWKGNWPPADKHSWEPRRCLEACPKLLADFDKKRKKKLEKKELKEKQLKLQRQKDRDTRAAAVARERAAEEETAKARLATDLAAGRRRSSRAARMSYVEYNSGGEQSESYGDLSTETECEVDLSESESAGEYSDAIVQPGQKPTGKGKRKRKRASKPRKRKRGGATTPRRRPKYAGPILPGTSAFKILKDVTKGDEIVKGLIPEKTGSPQTEFFVGIISKERSENVPMIHAMFTDTGMTPTWFVGKGEGELYRKAGAVHVQESGGLCASRNAVLDAAAAAGKICVQMSDDITSIQIVQEPCKWTRASCIDIANSRARQAPRWRVSPLGAARYLYHLMTIAEAKLGGAYPNCNHGFGFQQPPTSPNLFIVGDFLVCDVKNNPLRFDESMTLKEDYDFTAQHLHKYGRVCRSNRLFVKAQHYTNPGGAVAVRTPAKEQENIKILRTKWPEVFRRHGTRGPNEVLMRWARLDRSAMPTDLAKAGLKEALTQKYIVYPPTLSALPQQSDPEPKSEAMPTRRSSKTDSPSKPKLATPPELLIDMN